jgi:hypothetical protein
MSFLSVGIGKQHRKHGKQKGRPVGIGHNLGPPLATPLPTPLPNQVLTIREWAALNRISMRTASRILASGTGPVVTQLSPHRVGITLANNAKWQAARERG